MSKRGSYIEVEGLKEFNKAVSKAVDKDLPKRIGQANKKIGQLVISKLQPAPDPSAVGAGAGAAVRASATRREVLLRAGGAHRAHADKRVVRMRQWGKRVVRSADPPRRPYIQQTARANQREIEQAWLDAIAEAMRPAFHETES